MGYKRKTIKVDEVTKILQDEYDDLRKFAPGRTKTTDDIYVQRMHARLSELRLIAMMLKIDLIEKGA